MTQPTAAIVDGRVVLQFPPPKPVKLFLIGATGFVGGEVLAQAIADPSIDAPVLLSSAHLVARSLRRTP